MELRIMDPADEALIEASKLGVEDHTDEVAQRYDELLPALIEAEYAEQKQVTYPADFDYIWNFTKMGVARAEELVPE